MEPEVRIVHREETFNDLAVRELAKTRAACICRVQFGRCSKRDCGNCKQFQRVNNCQALMNDYDKSRLDTYTAEYYKEYSVEPMQWMSHSRFKKHYVLFVAGLIAFVLTVILPFAIVAQPVQYEDYYPDAHYYDRFIVNVQYKTQKAIRDVTGDGLINCQDWAIVWKRTWDETYPLMTNKAQIVHNYNPTTGMNHLLIHFYLETMEDLYIEPQANPLDFTAEKYWGKQFDPRYNHYGETDFWIWEVGAYY